MCMGELKRTVKQKHSSVVGSLDVLGLYVAQNPSLFLESTLLEYVFGCLRIRSMSQPGVESSSLILNLEARDLQLLTFPIHIVCIIVIVLHLLQTRDRLCIDLIFINWLESLQQWRCYRLDVDNVSWSDKVKYGKSVTT